MAYSGLSIFFTDKEETLFKRMGRELVETLIKQHFTLYKVDHEKTESDFYGEAKTKVYDGPYEIIGRVNIVDTDIASEGGLRRMAKGDMSAWVYNEHLSELNVDISVGDFIGFQGKFYEVYDPGYNKDSMNRKFAGDRDFYREILAKAIEGTAFKSIEGDNL